jgi:hypothetical protein
LGLLEKRRRSYVPASVSIKFNRLQEFFRTPYLEVVYESNVSMDVLKNVILKNDFGAIQIPKCGYHEEPEDRYCLMIDGESCSMDIIIFAESIQFWIRNKLNAQNCNMFVMKRLAHEIISVMGVFIEIVEIEECDNE